MGWYMACSARYSWLPAPARVAKLARRSSLGCEAGGCAASMPAPWRARQVVWATGSREVGVSSPAYGMLRCVASPTLRRRRLARELVRLRDDAGMTIEAASAAVGISASHLSRVERAQVGVRLPVVKLLLSTYDADTATSAYLTGIAKEASVRGW